MKCHLESCQRSRRLWCKTVKGKCWAFWGACGGTTGVMVTDCSNLLNGAQCNMHVAPAVIYIYSVYKIHVYNKVKRHDDGRDDWLWRISVCDMHQSISQIIFWWWCVYQRIHIHRSYSQYNTIILTIFSSCTHLKSNIFISQLTYFMINQSFFYDLLRTLVYLF